MGVAKRNLCNMEIGYEMRDALKYKDADGMDCTLDTLCRREPAWAANRIRVLQQSGRDVLGVLKRRLGDIKPVAADEIMEALDETAWSRPRV